MAMSGQDLDRRIHAALAPVDGVRLAYVFGSRARGAARADSDLDIAVAYPVEADGRARESLRRAAFAALVRELGALGEVADIVDVDAADSAVAFRAIHDGRRVLTRDERERVRIEVRIARRYDDDAPKRALFRRAARDAALRMQRQ
jgi:predicted nucleotidyltransferase